VNSSDTDALVLNQAVNPAMRLLVIGGGYTGLRFGRAVASQGACVTLTRRTPPDRAGDGGPLRWLHFDSRRGALPDAAALDGVTHLLMTAPPDGSEGDGVLTALAPLLRDLPLQWVGYLSTTGVYGDSGGAWVDEDTPLPAAIAGRSASRRRCEDHWRSLGVPLQILRLPGIYGPGRNPLAGLLRGEARLVHKPGQVFSRVHVDDIVGAILHNLALPAAHRPPLLNVADRRPAPSSEVLGFAAHLLGVPLPSFQWYAEAEAGMGPMARSFWQDNRRVSSRRLTDGLGYRLRYPTFREGLRGCLRDEGLPQGGGAAGS